MYVLKGESCSVTLLCKSSVLYHETIEFNTTIMNEKAGKEIGSYILLLIIFLLILEMFLAHFKLNQGKNN